jgi:hypothetical protein
MKKGFTPSRARTSRVLITKAVLTPPSGKADKKSANQSVFRTKHASALAFLSQKEDLSEQESTGIDMLGLYGRQPSALEQASSVTSAYRALLSSEDEYADEAESGPGLWEKLSGKRRSGDEYIM